jgi:hypothetical protein
VSTIGAKGPITTAITEQESRQLVERVASSRYLAKSARLRDLLLYLSEKALAGTEEIHEQEVGHEVFGRRRDYDTSSDNIVRVHASTLRKRLEHYFSEEGSAEPLILEIPKGNYAPIFRRRDQLAVLTAQPAIIPALAPVPAPAPARPDRRVAILAGVAGLFAVSTGVLVIRGSRAAPVPEQFGPTVRAFWAEVFRPAQPTDIVMDDATLSLYQELSGRSVSLSQYFDRSYLRDAALSENTLALRRQSNFADVTFLWRLFQFAGPKARDTAVMFARDYSFRNLKNDNAVLLGHQRSNPWIEPFLTNVGVRWNFDKEQGTYNPIDTWAEGGPASFHGQGSGDSRESYCGISLLANLGGNGAVLIVSATGGSAFNAAAAFLADEAAMSNLRRRLPGTGPFPHFEALVRVKGRSTQPRDAVVVICRPTRA